MSILTRDKRIYLHETERQIRGTRVIIRDSDTKEVLDEGSNSILYAGSINAALKDFHYYDHKDVDGTPKNLFIDVGDIAIPYSYDLAIYGNTNSTPSAEGVVCLFAVGCDGVENSMQSSQKKAVVYEGWIDPANMVPFRVAPSGSTDVNSAQRQLYAPKVTHDSFDYYYFKKFNSTPRIVTQYEVNGVDITTPQNAGMPLTTDGPSKFYNDYLLSNDYSSGAEVIVEMTCRITKDECREWFERTNGTHRGENPNISSVMICTAIPEFDADGNIITYTNIMPKSKRNITRELFLDDERGLEIVYQYIY